MVQHLTTIRKSYRIRLNHIGYLVMSQPSPKSPSTRTVLAAPVYDHLKERIMNRAVSPGARLNIDSLAAELGVSQTPLREALARLAAERLVSFEPYKGYSVTPLLTLRQLAELMQVRRLLETEAARQAANRISLTDLHSLQRVIEQMEAVEPRPEFRHYLPFNRLDQDFHQMIFQAAENRILLETYQGLNAHLWLARLDLTGSSIASRQSNLEHQAILQALKKHDPEAATSAVAQHLDNVEHRLGTYLQAGELAVKP